MYRATSSPMTKTVSSLSISSSMATLSASRTVICAAPTQTQAQQAKQDKRTRSSQHQAPDHPIEGCRRKRVRTSCAPELADAHRLEAEANAPTDAGEASFALGAADTRGDDRRARGARRARVGRTMSNKRRVGRTVRTTGEGESRALRLALSSVSAPAQNPPHPDHGPHQTEF